MNESNKDNITNLNEKRNQKTSQSFVKNPKGKILVRLHNTQIILNMLEINAYYDIIKKRVFLQSKNNHIFNSSISDYFITKILDYASQQSYNIGRATLTDHIHALARDNSINRVADFFEEARKKWDGVSRIDEVFKTLPIKTVEWYAKAGFLKWCIQAVKLAMNDGSMNQEFIFVLQGGQGSGKTTWLKMLFKPIAEYFKEGLDLNPSDKDSILECISHFVVELGELDATMKHEQAKLKAFITRAWDEVRKPYDRLPERTPRQTILCATVNEEQFLKDKTENRRYVILKIEDGERIDRLHHVDLEQFWGEIATLVYNGAEHELNDKEKKQQRIENNDFEMISDAEIRIESGLQWSAPKEHWRKVSTANICEILGMPSKSKIVSATLKRKGCEQWRTKNDRGWIVPPFTADRSNRNYTGVYV